MPSLSTCLPYCYHLYRGHATGPARTFQVKFSCKTEGIFIYIILDGALLVCAEHVWWQETRSPGGDYLHRSGQRAMTPDTAPSLDQYVDWGKVRSLLDRDSVMPSPAQPVELEVIDIQQDRVIEAPANCEYIALSYVSGSFTTIHPMGSSPFDLHSLPRIIRDSLVACCELGFRYLWVDQPCINQRDPVDQLHQINQMSRIYECVAYTLVALAGEDSSYGLPGVTKARSWDLKYISIAILISQHCHRVLVSALRKVNGIPGVGRFKRLCSPQGPSSSPAMAFIVAFAGKAEVGFCRKLNIIHPSKLSTCHTQLSTGRDERNTQLET